MTDPPVEDKRGILSKNPIYLGSAVFISDLVDDARELLFDCFAEGFVSELQAG
jgi:hypothetical protein